MCTSSEHSGHVSVVTYPSSGAATVWLSLDLGDACEPLLLSADTSVADVPSTLARLAHDLGDLVVGHQLGLPFD